MAFATADDVEADWRTLSPAEKVKATRLLDRAAWWLKVWFLDYGDIEALAAENTLLAEGLNILSCSMVRRGMTTGQIEGAASTYQVMGPFTSQIAFKNPDGNLYVTTVERDAILKLFGVNVSGAASMTSPGL